MKIMKIFLKNKYYQYLLKHLLSGVEFVLIFPKRILQVSDLFSLNLHLICQHTHLRNRFKSSLFIWSTSSLSIVLLKLFSGLREKHYFESNHTHYCTQSQTKFIYENILYRFPNKLKQSSIFLSTQFIRNTQSKHLLCTCTCCQNPTSQNRTNP